MEDNGMRTERKGTGKSAVGLLIVAVMVVVVIAAFAWALSQPGFFEELVNILVLAVIVIVAVLVAAYIAYAFIAVAMYAKKGEVVQTGVTHSIDDVKGVEGRTLDENGNDIDDSKKE